MGHDPDFTGNVQHLAAETRNEGHPTGEHDSIGHAEGGDREEQIIIREVAAASRQRPRGRCEEQAARVRVGLPKTGVRHAPRFRPPGRHGTMRQRDPRPREGQERHRGVVTRDDATGELRSIRETERDDGRRIDRRDGGALRRQGLRGRDNRQQKYGMHAHDQDGAVTPTPCQGEPWSVNVEP